MGLLDLSSNLGLNRGHRSWELLSSSSSTGESHVLAAGPESWQREDALVGQSVQEDHSTQQAPGWGSHP